MATRPVTVRYGHARTEEHGGMNLQPPMLHMHPRNVRIVATVIVRMANVHVQLDFLVLHVKLLIVPLLVMMACLAVAEVVVSACVKCPDVAWSTVSWHPSCTALCVVLWTHGMPTSSMVVRVMVNHGWKVVVMPMELIVLNVIVHGVTISIQIIKVRKCS